jgi:exopolyphosphatase/guanosine-5'-triphosphate,3'-diphosphate pyrophosphatase
MPDSAAKGRIQLKDGDLLAAVDLGSNSFHLVVARYSLEQLKVIDRLRDPIRLAGGLNPDGSLDPAKRERALAVLSRFGQRLRAVPSERVRAVATNTFRQMRAPRAFQTAAEEALGHPIEIVSGREEARLIYQGVIQGIRESGRQRLVIDIGGGSTEFIIGLGAEALETESLQMGCVASTRRFFGDGKLSGKRWKQAFTEVSAELQQFAADYLMRGWGDVVGSSGTVKAIGRIARAGGWYDRGITPESLERIRDRLLKADSIDEIDLPELSNDRRQVIAGGLVVLEASFDVLRIERMQVCETAMREGLLHDLLGRAQHRDPRQATIDALAQRFSVDRNQAERVEATALALFGQIESAWHLGEAEHDWLAWAARVHEVGLSIAHSQHHIHGAYLLANSDLPGFTRGEQEVLALLVRCHRREIPVDALQTLPERLFYPTVRLTILLRLAALLHRPRSAETPSKMTLAVDDRVLRFDLPKRWLESHPLTAMDLAQERKYLKPLGFKLELD